MCRLNRSSPVFTTSFFELISPSKTKTRGYSANLWLLGRHFIVNPRRNAHHEHLKADDRGCAGTYLKNDAYLCTGNWSRDGEWFTNCTSWPTSILAEAWKSVMVPYHASNSFLLRKLSKSICISSFIVSAGMLIYIKSWRSGLAIRTRLAVAEEGRTDAFAKINLKISYPSKQRMDINISVALE